MKGKIVPIFSGAESKSDGSPASQGCLDDTYPPKETCWIYKDGVEGKRRERGRGGEKGWDKMR